MASPGTARHGTALHGTARCDAQCSPQSERKRRRHSLTHARLCSCAGRCSRASECALLSPFAGCSSVRMQRRSHAAEALRTALDGRVSQRGGQGRPATAGNTPLRPYFDRYIGDFRKTCLWLDLQAPHRHSPQTRTHTHVRTHTNTRTHALPPADTNTRARAHTHAHSLTPTPTLTETHPYKHAPSTPFLMRSRARPNACLRQRARLQLSC